MNIVDFLSEHASTKDYPFDNFPSESWKIIPNAKVFIFGIYHVHKSYDSKDFFKIYRESPTDLALEVFGFIKDISTLDFYNFYSFGGIFIEYTLPEIYEIFKDGFSLEIAIKIGKGATNIEKFRT